MKLNAIQNLLNSSMNTVRAKLWQKNDKTRVYYQYASIIIKDYEYNEILKESIDNVIRVTLYSDYSEKNGWSLHCQINDDTQTKEFIEEQKEKALASVSKFHSLLNDEKYLQLFDK